MHLEKVIETAISNAALPIYRRTNSHIVRKSKSDRVPKDKHGSKTVKEAESIFGNVEEDVEKAVESVETDSSGMAEAAQPPEIKARLCCSVRLMTAIITSGALLLNYCTIFSLSFAILCMVKQAPKHGHQTRLNARARPEFDWDRTTQGLVLSAFYAGFAITLILGGFVADYYKAKLVLVYGNLAQGALSLLLPVASRLLGPIALGGLRVLQGLASGVVVPCVYVLLAKWAAATERTRLLGLAYLGIPLSEIITYPVAGALCELRCDNGWPFIFYVIGATTVLFTLLLLCLVHEWPHQHPFISEKEKAFLEATIRRPTGKKKRPPWGAMAKSGAVWSYIICYCSQQWGFQVMSIFTPDFMQDVMNFDIHENGFLSAVPYIGMFIMRATQTSLFNAIREKSHLSLTVLRKINHGIGSLVPTIALICMEWVKDSPVACVVLLTVNMTVQDLAFTGGFGFCNVDFAPAFAGILSGMGMSVSIVLCVAMPNIVAALTPNGTHSEWMVVFYITACFYLIAFIAYNRLGTSELQPWGLGEVISEEEHNQNKAAKAQEKADKNAAKAKEKADKEAAKAKEKADKEAAQAKEKADKEAAKAK